MRALAALAVVALALAASACGSSEEEGYSPQVEESLTTECIKSATASGQGAFTEEEARSYCKCTYDEIEATVPFQEFAEYDEKAREDEDIPLPPKMEAAVEKCVEELDA